MTPTFRRRIYELAVVLGRTPDDPNTPKLGMGPAKGMPRIVPGFATANFLRPVYRQVHVSFVTSSSQWSKAKYF